ncbi:helix-turn-helix transcriptional regulator [Brevibacterium picturae]|uniref:HTH cro/C1-type domain-containing protein n=1 Tax=Brevibacterium picturae TaxID=260553 RepID=A0ABP4MWP3_9MICO
MGKQETSNQVEARPDRTAENFRANMVKYREELGLSPGDIAQRLNEGGYSSFYRQTIQRVENGDRALRLDEAFAISEILGKTVQEMTDSKMETDLIDALHRVEVKSGGLVSIAAGEKLSAQAILAETADLLAESGKLSEQHAERVLAALAESVIGDARGAAEKAATLPDHSARGKFGNYWLCAQREAMSTLPGYRINVFEHGDQMRVGLLHLDPATELDDLTRTGLDPIDQDELVELLKACTDLMNSLVKEDPDHREARRLSWLFDKFKR